MPFGTVVRKEGVDSHQRVEETEGRLPGTQQMAVQEADLCTTGC